MFRWCVNVYVWVDFEFEVLNFEFVWVFDVVKGFNELGFVDMIVCLDGV